MKKYTFFHKVKLKFRSFIGRFKEERTKIDRISAKTTDSIKKLGVWSTGAKVNNCPRPYPPYDRSNNEKSRRMFFPRRKMKNY